MALHRVELEPVGPVSTQFDEVVEVNQTRAFQIVDKGGDNLIRRKRSDKYEVALYLKFLIREIESGVELCTNELDPLIGVFAYEKRRTTRNDRKWHIDSD